LHKEFQGFRLHGLDPHDSGDPGAGFGVGYRAAVGRSLSLGHRGGKRVAAGVPTSAAVCTGKIFTDLIDPGILLHGEKFTGKAQEKPEAQAQAA